MVDREHPSLSWCASARCWGSAVPSIYYRPRAASGRGPVPDERERPAVPGDALLWVKTDEGLAGAAGRAGEPEAGAAADARHGLRATYRRPSTTAGRRSTRSIVPAEEGENHRAQPGVGRGYHLPAHGPGGSSTSWR